MNKEAIYDTWAPAGGRWSPWVKPVLFACMDRAMESPPSLPVEIDLAGAPRAGDTAVVVDLPGDVSVAVGLALASRGFRPIPLFNAMLAPVRGAIVPPGPPPVAQSSSLGIPMAMADPPFAIGGNPFRVNQGVGLVDVHAIVDALRAGAGTLQGLVLPDSAPPVFLLDSNRRGDGRFPSPGMFDNRSVSFVTDFPSATFLQAHGIEFAMLVQARAEAPAADLAHTLRRWQDAGIRLSLKPVDPPGDTIPLTIPKPAHFGRLWQRILGAMGFRRHVLGGFGGIVPMPSQG